MKLGLYFHTARHLRLSQIVYRIRFRLWRPRPDLRAAPGLRQKRGIWVQPCEKKPSLLARDRAIFLNETHDISSPTIWNDPALAKLWLYNLHYFDDLSAAGAAERQEWHLQLIERWIAENPPGYGNGWEPYTTSIRIVNWIKWALAGHPLPVRAVNSLVVQIRFLSQQLEYHLLGNHLFANAKALVFAGAFFDGEEAEGWLRTGLHVLRRELPEQVLPDGGHFERSPMYHSIILEDCLDMENLAVAYGMGGIVDLAVTNRMREWLSAMCHSDGEIAFFNDAAFGIAAHPAEIERYAVRLGYAPVSMSVGLTHLFDSGYVSARRGVAVLLIDIAPLGPDYLPGHAHADTLSFELSLYGRRVMVNSGTSCYGTGSERQQERSTRAHNTLVIDGQDSSEMWGGFRVARRARVHDVRADEAGSAMHISATHDGYQRLAGRNHHRRYWHLEESVLVIEDEITGNFGQAEVHYHLHPEVRVLQSSPDSAWLELPQEGRTVRLMVEGGRMAVLQDVWHPEFGLSIVNSCLVVCLNGNRLKTRIVWEGVH